MKNKKAIKEAVIEVAENITEKAEEVVEKAKQVIEEAKKETYTKAEIEDGKGMGVVAYLLPFIPYFIEKKNNFVKFHATQGMNLLVLSIAYAIISFILRSIIKVNTCYAFICFPKTPSWLVWILSILGLSFLVFVIMGIVDVVNGKARELPLIGKIKIFKKK